MKGGQQSRGKTKAKENRRNCPAVWGHAMGARARGFSAFYEGKRVGGKRETGSVVG